LKKTISSILVLLCALAAGGAVYLNEAIFPRKIKSALIEGFESATGKKIELSSVKLDFFKGLVIKDLAILDKDLWVMRAKEADCRFLILPLFKKQIMITSLELKNAQIFLERRKDNSFDIIETFFKEPILLNGKYSLTILRVVLSAAAVNYKDSALDPALTKEVKNVFLDVHLSLPDKIKFDTEFELPSRLAMIFKVNGEYKALKKEVSLDVKAKDIYLKEFAPYFKGQNMDLPEGRADIEAAVKAGSGILSADITMTSLGLGFSQDGIKADLNCALKAKARYDLNSKTLIYSGELDIKNLALSGLEYITRIDDIRGKAIFTESRFLSKNLTCTLAGLPVTARADLTDFKTGALNIDVASSVELSVLKGVLKSRFNMKLPADVKGPGRLSLKLEYKIPIADMPVINGYLDVGNAKIILDYNKIPLDNVKGRFKFTSNQLLWEDATFKHMDTDYISSGALTNFEKPGIDIKLDSKRLSVRSLIAVNDSFLTLSRFEGRYEATEFSMYGDLDTTDPANITAELNGVVKFELDGNRELLKRFENIMKDSKPSGRLTAKFALKGNISDLDSCAADVEVSGSRVLLYGFKIEDFTMSYMQRSGVMDIVKMRASLYGGILNGSGRIDLASKDGAYQIKAEVEGLKIEKIRLDTALKDYDISGSIYSRFGFKGYSSDPSKFSAWGKINISNGRLWQLNLFRGIGTLIFRKDFSSVIFKNGDCDFSIKDKAVSTNDISLRSDLLNISGVARIGFDNSIMASLKAEFTDEGVDASKMAGAIERYSIIEVSGTLKEPKTMIRPDLSNVMSDIAEGLFQQ
jgi:uncharacterized protein involved in outer membrane biogenesis